MFFFFNLSKTAKFHYQTGLDLTLMIREFFLTKITLKLILNIGHHVGKKKTIHSRLPKTTLKVISYLTEKHQICILY